MLCKVHLGDCVGLCAYICVQRPKEVIGGLSLLLSSCLDMNHLVESEAYCFGEAGRQLLGIHLCPPVLGLCTCAAILTF